MTLTDPARLSPGDLLAALRELSCAKAAAVYAALGFAVVPMHTAQPVGRCSCPDQTCPDRANTRGCADGSDWPRPTRRWWGSGGGAGPTPTSAW